MNWSHFFLNPAVVWILIPIIAILVTGIQKLCKMHYRHQERMALIQQGMYPDAEPPAAQGDDERWKDTTAHV